MSYHSNTLVTFAEQIYDVKVRVTQSMVRFDKLRNILDANEIDTTLKLRLYEASICSILTFGCETWNLDRKTIKIINGANSKILSRFTGKSIPQEARASSTSFNLIRKIRQRRLRWVGHLLRVGPSRITYHVLVTQWRLNHEGNLLSDVPCSPSLIHANTRSQKWRWTGPPGWMEHVNSLPHFYWCTRLLS